MMERTGAGVSDIKPDCTPHACQFNHVGQQSRTRTHRHMTQDTS